MNAMIFAQVLLAQAGPNTDGINSVLTGTLDRLVGNFAQVQSGSSKVLVALLTIEFAVMLIYHMVNPNLEELLKNVIQKFFMAIVVIFLTLNWGWFTGAIRGYVVGGAGGGQTMTQGLHPGAIAENGIQKVAVIFNDPERLREIARTFAGEQDKKKPEPPKKPESDSIFSLEGKIPDVGGALEQIAEDAKATMWGMVALLIFTILAMMVVFVHFYVALQVFVIMVEFYIITSITACFIPFAVNKHTSYLATGAINAVIGSSVKVAVLAMIIGMMGDPIQQMTLSNSPNMYEMLSLILGSATMAFVVRQAPSIAQAAFSGGGAGIDVGSMVSSAGSTVAAAASLGATGAAGTTKAAAWTLGKAANAGAWGVGQGANAAAWGVGQGAKIWGAMDKLDKSSQGGSSVSLTAGLSDASAKGSASGASTAQAGQSGTSQAASFDSGQAQAGQPSAQAGGASQTVGAAVASADRDAAQAPGAASAQAASSASTSPASQGAESGANPSVSGGPSGQPSSSPRHLPTLTVEALPQVPSSKPKNDTE